MTSVPEGVRWLQICKASHTSSPNGPSCKVHHDDGDIRYRASVLERLCANRGLSSSTPNRVRLEVLEKMGRIDEGWCSSRCAHIRHELRIRINFRILRRDDAAVHLINVNFLAILHDDLA